MRWTDEQEREIARRYAGGETLRTLGAAFHTSDRQLKAVLVQRGVTLRDPKRAPAPLAARVTREIGERYARGEGIDAIAEALHLSANRVKDALIGARVEIRPVNARKFDHLTESAIARRYADGESTATLAAEYGCAAVTIREITRRKGLAIDPRGNKYREFTAEELAEMAGMWHAGQSQTAIAQHFGTGQVVISRVLRANGIEPVTRLRRGETSNFWKGGRIQDGSGYFLVSVPHDHQFASMRNRTGYIPEHRLVMAQQLGRPLMKHETVHHINGDKGDNRPENLQLRNGRHGNGTTYRCADCGSYHIIAEPIASRTED